MSRQVGRTTHSPLPPYENAVFVSYKWGGDGEEIVNQIGQALQTRGVKLIRDKHDLGYKSSIRQFMERIGQGTCVIVIISDAYLRSQHCMFELMEIAEGKQFNQRVFPIVLSDASIYDPLEASEYVKYWEEKRAELVEAMQDLDQANLQDIHDKIDLYDRIRDEISGLISALNDMNTLTPELLGQGDYALLAEAIAERTLSNDSISELITSGSSELGESPMDSLPDDTMDARQRLIRNLPSLSPIVLVTLIVGTITAVATIIAALIQITPDVVDFFNSRRVIVSPPPACITMDDILVRLHVWKGLQRIATLVPSGMIKLEADQTVELQVEFKSVSDQLVPALECAWDNANTENITSPTEGKLLYTAGCTVDYQSGHTKITDTLSLQVSQASCPGLLSYAFFIFPKE